jgi:hypothetical protein
MDFFDAFPLNTAVESAVLRDKNLRLIALSGFVYDNDAIYFEISPQKFWGRLPTGEFSIGIGLPKVKPDGIHPPHKGLMDHLRKQWRCKTFFHSPGYTFLMDVDNTVSLLQKSNMPFILQLTPPRLGGGTKIPDALVQAVYLLPVEHFNWKNAFSKVDIMRISRAGFDSFLEQEIWSLEHIRSQSWCDLKLNDKLPEESVMRMVLTLRSIRQLLHSKVINLDVLHTSIPN